MTLNKSLSICTVHLTEIMANINISLKAFPSIQQLLSLYRVKAQKNLSQNFLLNNKINGNENTNIPVNYIYY